VKKWNKNLKLVLFGFLVWLIPFLVSFVVSFKGDHEALI